MLSSTHFSFYFVQLHMCRLVPIAQIQPGERSIAKSTPQRVLFAGFVQLHMFVQLFLPSGREAFIAHGTAQRILLAVAQLVPILVR